MSRAGTAHAPAGGAAPAAARVNPVLVLWRFSRPHTVIGTALSVIGLWVIAATTLEVAPPVWDLAATLVAGLTVNIAIVGVNQLTDVEIDRVNKPFLPIAAVFLDAKALVGDKYLSAVLTLMVVVFSLLMITSTKYPKLTKFRSLAAPVAMLLIAMPFVGTRVLAFVMVVIGLLYVALAPFLVREEAS